MLCGHVGLAEFMTSFCDRCDGGIPLGIRMRCLGFSNAEMAVERPTGCLFCVVFIERLHLARLEAMRKWVSRPLM